MSLNHDVVGVRSDPVEKSWTSTDALLYALGVGAGHDNPLEDLAYTTEHGPPDGGGQKVVPSYGVMLTWGTRGRKLGDFDPAMLVHAEQAIELHRPLPPQGTVSITSTVTSIEDKRSGALVRSAAEAVLVETGEPLVTSRSGIFIRGEGGFGGQATAAPDDTVPDRDPDERIVTASWPGQALLYRLSGDRNPLHSDPSFAARGGFPRPILHGLCTYGITCRSLVDAVAKGDGDAMRSMSGRFSAPVLPGDELTVEVWDVDAGLVAFRVRRTDGTVVIDRGRAGFSLG
ncbi:MaoC/PaaZ C-terminal domain-containing protein [Aeromicrobium duanguangcaii]|uniref:MaoC/PaaZ C-terminal domain-containing protein n=1 Tax=Aeromicrobium duanguangcaii TaxID=2968086 RepID=A0ABY5KDN4_9ACTN|nr:MaoC/PaaZ C-terminal domain-containing protein [Aeromicrobium duanguangcaii]MCD9154509.1 MaoC family dehydratase N-terminal domain-containing protein [Aeromicrobium duanguangcaii]MCL3838257.1 MaoC family dehydratase N-terminal domain-containing protein [Aeromicrobium duanguangcaii]UUI68435.1 MaoC/PaaZ C-terminal domain-containing protein [Aeromicrobium duanguangcaii]